MLQIVQGCWALPAQNEATDRVECMTLTIKSNNIACNICYMVDILRKDLGYKLLIIKRGWAHFSMVESVAF